MELAEIKITSWDKIQYYELPNNDISLTKGDFVIIKCNGNKDLGQYIGCKQVDKDSVVKITLDKEKGDETKMNNSTGSNKTIIKGSIIEKAKKEDIQKMPSLQDKEKALNACQKFIDKHKLDMKLVDVHFSFDQSKITFAFIAEERVDFRSLVRDLIVYFNCAIRLHQIGKRDEAKAIGDCGPCGRILCCKSFIKDFASITSKMAETQQVAHRGNERISGLCSRLKCCLQYEQEGYKELTKKMPNIGEEIQVNGKKATVVNCNVLKQTVDAKFKNNKNEDNNEETLMEVDINTRKKI